MMLKFTAKPYWPETQLVSRGEVIIGELVLIGDGYEFWPEGNAGFIMNELTQINDMLYRLNHEVVVDADIC